MSRGRYRRCVPCRLVHQPLSLLRSCRATPGRCAPPLHCAHAPDLPLATCSTTREVRMQRTSEARGVCVWQGDAARSASVRGQQSCRRSALPKALTHQSPHNHTEEGAMAAPMPAQMPAQMPAPQPGAVGGGDGRGGMRGGGMRGRGRGGFRGGGGGYGGGFIMPGGFRGGRGMRGKFYLLSPLSLALSRSLALSLSLSRSLSVCLALADFLGLWAEFFFGGGGTAISV